MFDLPHWFDQNFDKGGKITNGIFIFYSEKVVQIETILIKGPFLYFILIFFWIERKETFAKQGNKIKIQIYSIWTFPMI